jgi:hypothetical protein
LTLLSLIHILIIPVDFFQAKKRKLERPAGNDVNDGQDQVWLPYNDEEEEPQKKSSEVQTDVNIFDVGKLYSNAKIRQVHVHQCATDGRNAATQSTTTLYEDKSTDTKHLIYLSVKKSKKVQVNFRSSYLLEQAMKSDQACKHQCGVPKKFFIMIDKALPMIKSSRVLTKQDKLLLFIMKLRYNDPYTRLGCLFQVHRTTASDAFKEVLTNFYALAKSRLWWLSREEVNVMMPESFKKHYPQTRVIIDASEVNIEVPQDVDAAALFYSHYKSHHTYKFLLGISPHGMITYISQAYGGRTTDGHITSVSALYDLLEHGDSVMADKGFPEITASLLERHALIVMPPFRQSSGRQFTEVENRECYNVASVRIHVERAIQRMKLFDILKDMENSLLPQVDMILVSISYICNNFRPLINEKQAAAAVPVPIPVI